MRPNIPNRQAGLTIVELMVSLALGLLVLLLATVLLMATKSAYIAHDEVARVHDTGRYAIESIARAARQAAYENWDREQAPLVAVAEVGPNISGLDARSLKENSWGIESPVLSSVNGSDVLAVRFFGAGSGSNGDGTMLNCAGFGVAAANSSESADADRGWSIFYVAADSEGEPELRCKYRGKTAWSSAAIARGVESFQVLYGVDTDADGLPNRFLTATAIQGMDDALILAGDDAAGKAIDRNRKTYWKKVVVVKAAILVRGNQGARTDTLNKQYDLFGKDYADIHAGSDRGTRIKEADLPHALRNRLRKAFVTTIQLRNQASGGAA
jgi:type IV pilus assembly protein PilW